MSLPDFVKIVEVGARDGLQNEKKIVPAETKIKLINLLSDSGLSSIEVTSFVSPKWVPQMADNAEVFSGISKQSNVSYSALVPNMRGLDAAIENQVKEIAVFISASESFSQKNINCSIAESFDRIKPVIQKALANDIKVRGYLSCVLGCPYEGEIKANNVVAIADTLFQLGCYEISMGDTTGVGTPSKARTLFELAAKNIPIPQLAGHFHNTYGQALANIFSILEIGVNVFDSAIAGLGGCPYAKGASGNVSTEDLLYMLNGLEINTNVSMDKLLVASKFISKELNRKTTSNVANALLKEN